MKTQTQNHLSVSLTTDRGIDSVFRMNIWYISSTTILFWYSSYVRYLSMKTVDRKNRVATVDKQKER